MLRSSLFLAGAVVLAGTASAQQIDYSKLRTWPLNKIRRPGIYHVAEQRWERPDANGVVKGIPGFTTVYENTCFWVGGFPNATFFFGSDACIDIYDNGQIPTPGNFFNPGVSADSNITTISVGYITFAPPGTQSIEYKFWDNLGGTCVGFSSPTPPEPPGQGTIALNTVSPVTSPADPNLGSGQGWIFTIDLTGTGLEFCLQNDGDGTWAGFGGTGDDFNWRFRHNNNSVVTGSTGEGPFIAGEILAGAAGSCTFAVPCGTQIITGFTEGCGTGFGSADAFWSNADATVPCTNAGSTACFFFGGAPSASFYLALQSDGDCTDPEFLSYCVGKTSSQGCVPFIQPGGTGLPSVTDTGTFNLQGRDSVDGGTGLIVYSYKKANLNFHGGKICVKAPTTRTAGKSAKSKVPEVCVGPLTIGRLTTNFNNRIQGSFDPLLTAGNKVFVQWLARDNANTIGGFGDTATNGLRFTILP